MNAVREGRSCIADGQSNASDIHLGVESGLFLHESATPRLRQSVALAARVTVELEYVGSGALKALGHRTGRRYCFGGPGARVAVDARDRPGLAAVASLREVQG